MAHAEGLAGQHTAQHHTFKQVCLGKIRQQDGGGFTDVDGARKAEQSMQRQAAALNKPAFRRASKRG